MNKVAVTIAHLRTARGLTPAALSRKAGLRGAGHIYQLESGEFADPRLSTLEKLAAAFEMPTCELVRHIDAAAPDAPVAA